MSEYSDQAIFDAITAATRIENDYGGQSTQAIIIDVKKFIEVFNGHRDRALCASVAPSPAALEKASHHLLWPDSEFTTETFESFCPKCVPVSRPHQTSGASHD